MPSNPPSATTTNRRRFLAVTGSSLVGSVSTAGCVAVGRRLRSPSIDWRTALDDTGWVNSPLVVLDGRVLAATSHQLVALDTTSGDVRWKSESWFHHVTRGPVVAGGVAVVGDDQWAGYRGDGTEVWALDSEYNVRPLTTVDDSLVVGGASTSEGGVTAIDATDGSVRWQTTPDNWENANGKYAAYDAVETEFGVVAADFDGPVSALTADGSVLWTQSDDWDTPGPGRPSLAGEGDVVAAASGAVVGFDAATGDRRWRHVLPDYASGVTVAGGTAYVAVGSDDAKTDSWNAAGGVLAFDLGDGTERWRTTLPDPATPPAAVGGEVVVGTAGGHLAGLDAASGERRWERPVGSRVATAPVVDASRTAVGVVDSERTVQVVALSN